MFRHRGKYRSLPAIDELFTLTRQVAQDGDVCYRRLPCIWYAFNIWNTKYTGEQKVSQLDYEETPSVIMHTVLYFTTVTMGFVSVWFDAFAKVPVGMRCLQKKRKFRRLPAYSARQLCLISGLQWLHAGLPMWQSPTKMEFQMSKEIRQSERRHVS